MNGQHTCCGKAELSALQTSVHPVRQHAADAATMHTTPLRACFSALCSSSPSAAIMSATYRAAGAAAMNAWTGKFATGFKQRLANVGLSACHTVL